ncbi:hypothetical protein SAY87_022720 [Trapa incisa]|uniref:GIR1-like zinc ribbon domain-containing protein n=1 Tax=Trapa incisa TaxID=236973 RepID=A0AAN7Q5W5_9MYRT|nr:hypothetical protein SAY87_022720 [Trapa incisa]
MSKRSGAGLKLDLKLNLNLSPPRADSPRSDAALSPTGSGSTNSCLSSEVHGTDLHRHDHSRHHISSSSSPEETSMVLMGCARCLMYVMLSEDDPKCPRCKSTVLLSFQHETSKYNNSINNRNKKKIDKCLQV